MPLFKLSEIELRDAARSHIEVLEFWLRRLVDEELQSHYGTQYWMHQEDGKFLLKQDIVEKVNTIYNYNPSRYPRWIDASLLDHLIYIICREDLYKAFFKKYLEYNYPAGKNEFKFFVEKLYVSRNSLAHGNPITVRQVEQAICYSNDIIDSIKNFYKINNMNKDFNVPLIMSYADTEGNKIYRGQMLESVYGVQINLRRDNDVMKFHCGSRVKFFIEVDPSFDSNDYTITWKKMGLLF